MGGLRFAGGKPDMAVPVAGILASELAVGSVVKLMEDGVATEYLVVNQGKPSGSSLYDDSCDGLWLLRKDIKENRQWNISNVNAYANSTIHAWLNGDFFNSLGDIERAVVKQVKIPYCVGNGRATVNGGTNGLSAKAFFLSSYEVSGIIPSSIKEDGVKLEYFIDGNDEDAKNKRQAFINGSPGIYGLRSPNTDNTTYISIVGNNGSAMQFLGADQSVGIRPALVLPINSKFDPDTMLLKGVA